MIRNAFRRGLALGLVGGAAAAAVKALQGRRSSTPAPAPATEWPPMTPVPDPVLDVVVAPGPDPQPARAPEPEPAPAPVAAEEPPEHEPQPGAHPGLAAVVLETPDGLSSAPGPNVDPITSGTPAAWPTTPAAEAEAITPPVEETQPEPTIEVHTGAAVGADPEDQPESVAREWQPPEDVELPPPPPPAPAAEPAKKRAPAKRVAKRAPAPWIEPAEGGCPASHPVKAKLSSKIFHLPGMLNYERTTPDRCYVDAEAAEADGLRSAKR